jgi:hypothetical protein
LVPKKIFYCQSGSRGFFSSSPHKEGHNDRVKGSQDFLNSQCQIGYLSFCAFTRILTVFFDVGTATRQTHTISPLAQLPFFFFEKGDSEAIAFFFEKQFLKGDYARNSLKILSQHITYISP